MIFPPSWFQQTVQRLTDAGWRLVQAPHPANGELVWIVHMPGAAEHVGQGFSQYWAWENALNYVRHDPELRQRWLPEECE